MAFFTDYTTLQATIASYLARSDLTTQIPEFIRLAEDRLVRDLRIRQLIKVAVTPTVAGDATVSLPSDFTAIKDLHLQGNPPQTIKFLSTSNFFRNAHHQPEYLSDTNSSNLWLANTPDLLLYAALGEAEPYLMNDERLNTWASMYDRGVTALRKSDDDAEYPAQPLTITNSTR